MSMQYQLPHALPKNRFFLVVGVALLLFSFSTHYVVAEGEAAASGPLIQSTLLTPLERYLSEYSKAAKIFAPASPASIVTSLIFNALLVSGAIFVGLMVYAGSRWLFSHGNEEEITKSKNLVLHTLIGLAIVLSAYTISFYILRAATGILFYSTSEVRDINQYRADENYDPEQGDIFPW